MATKLRHKRTGGIFLLLGTGYGVFQSQVAGNWIQTISPETDQGEFYMVAVCDARGEICWGDSREFEVIEVDGSRPSELLDPNS
ncbi:MAG: hypothetical protein NXI32_12340 [bacterium]|nr:hypothetical protein [bacterium]